MDMPSSLYFFGPQTGQEDPFGSKLWPFWSRDLPSGLQHSVQRTWRLSIMLAFTATYLAAVVSVAPAAKLSPALCSCDTLWPANVAWNPPKTHMLLTNTFLQSLPAGRKCFWSCRTSMALSQMDPGKLSGVAAWRAARPNTCTVFMLC